MNPGLNIVFFCPFKIGNDSIHNTSKFTSAPKRRNGSRNIFSQFKRNFPSDRALPAVSANFLSSSWSGSIFNEDQFLVKTKVRRKIPRVIDWDVKHMWRGNGSTLWDINSPQIGITNFRSHRSSSSRWRLNESWDFSIMKDTERRLRKRLLQRAVNNFQDVRFLSFRDWIFWKMKYTWTGPLIRDEGKSSKIQNARVRMIRYRSAPDHLHSSVSGFRWITRQSTRFTLVLFVMMQRATYSSRNPFDLKTSLRVLVNDDRFTMEIFNRRYAINVCVIHITSLLSEHTRTSTAVTKLSVNDKREEQDLNRMRNRENPETTKRIREGIWWVRELSRTRKKTSQT